jgi:hypothetical protein
VTTFQVNGIFKPNRVRFSTHAKSKYEIWAGMLDLLMRVTVFPCSSRLVSAACALSLGRSPE